MTKEQDIKEYIERYARCRHITPEEASKHLIVKQYIEYKTNEKLTNNERYYL